MPKKDLLVLGGSIGAGLALLIVLVVAGRGLIRSRSAAGKSWDQDAIKATYVKSQLKEIDKEHSSLTLSYDLENKTDTDYRLADGPGVVILSRLKSDGSLSQEQPARLSYPVFLPARQHARMAIEITELFVWPAQDDPAYEDRLRGFVEQRLAKVGEFVLFDEATRRQLRLPSAWEKLQDATQVTY